MDEQPVVGSDSIQPILPKLARCQEHSQTQPPDNPKLSEQSARLATVIQLLQTIKPKDVKQGTGQGTEYIPEVYPHGKERQTEVTRAQTISEVLAEDGHMDQVNQAIPIRLLETECYTSPPSLPTPIPTLTTTQEWSGKRERLVMESVSHPPNYKTRPCRLYHSENGGCTRGEFCHFIHDPKYVGKELPPERWRNRKRPLSALPSYPAYPPDSVSMGIIPQPLYHFIPLPGIAPSPSPSPSPPPPQMFHFPPHYLQHPNLPISYIPRMPPH